MSPTVPVTPVGGLSLTRPRAATYVFGGLVGERLAADLEHWQLVAPQANPAMIQMFCDRDRLPRRDLVPWAGEFVGKYLTAGTLAWRLCRDVRLQDQLQRVVDALISAQDNDGYLGPHPREQRFTGTTVDGNLGIRELWDLWGHYQCMLGLLLWHQEMGDERALTACRRAADCICARFLDSGESVLAAKAPEKNMAVIHGFCLLYQRTGEARYLRMAREIERLWQVPPAGDYVRVALAGVPFFQTPQPRWESLHSIQAILSLYEITGEEQYRQAFEHYWCSIRAHDRRNTGGFTAGEKANGNPYSPTGIETCGTVAWMALSADMLRLTGDSQVADELELSTLNAALGSQSPSGRWWTYSTPMDGVRKASAHAIVFQAREGSPELNCCAVNGPRSLGMLSEWAVMGSRQGTVLNYYGPSTFTLSLPDGQRLVLRQQTEYPRRGTIGITVEPERDTVFALSLRIPAWSRQTRVEVDGQMVAGVEPGRYLTLARKWQPGDKIDLTLDLSLRRWQGEREAASKASLYYGPLLLAYDRRFNDIDPEELQAPDPAVAPELVEYKGWGPAPWILLRFRDVAGRDLFLCDFALAGAAGTPYRTWLPYVSGPGVEK